MPQNLLLLFELLGTVAFALSGAMVALSKKMDIFGVAVLGLVTAVGGGVIRDLVLGITPPATFKNPVYATVAIIVSVAAFVPSIRRFLFAKPGLYDKFLLFMDSIGLGIFTVVGIETAYIAGHSSSWFLLIFVGVITGCGGGILRDILAQNTPAVLVKHFYASASIIGAVVCILLWKLLGQSAAIIGGAFSVLVLRLLAAKYQWSLPKPENDFE